MECLTCLQRLKSDTVVQISQSSDGNLIVLDLFYDDGKGNCLHRSRCILHMFAFPVHKAPSSVITHGLIEYLVSPPCFTATHSNVFGQETELAENAVCEDGLPGELGALASRP